MDVSGSEDVCPISKKADQIESLGRQKKVDKSVKGQKAREVVDQNPGLMDGLGPVGLGSPRPGMGDSSIEFPVVGLSFSSKMDPMNPNGLLATSNYPTSGRPSDNYPDTHEGPLDDESLLPAFLGHRKKKGVLTESQNKSRRTEEWRGILVPIMDVVVVERGRWYHHQQQRRGT